MKLKDRLSYKILQITYGKKNLNQKPAKIGNTLKEIDELLGDVVHSVNKKDKKDKKDQKKTGC